MAVGESKRDCLTRAYDSGEAAHRWPTKMSLFGVGVTPTDYAEASRCVIRAAKERQPSIVSCHAVHALVTTSRDAWLKSQVNRFDMITPDGQPVRWALNLIHGAKLPERVYGPQLTLDICKRAAEEGVSVYFYGGSQEAVTLMASRLQNQFPNLVVAGAESPPFRELSEDEDSAMVARLNASGAGVVFIGLGFPKQDIFAAKHRGQIQAVQVCVGAAFDFHAGLKKTAPGWMQRSGMEWFFRLCAEPRRLWKRYLVTNSLFLWQLAFAFPQRQRIRQMSTDGNSIDD